MWTGRVRGREVVVRESVRDGCWNELGGGRVKDAGDWKSEREGML